MPLSSFYVLSNETHFVLKLNSSNIWPQPSVVRTAVVSQTDYPGNDIMYWTGPYSGCAQACASTQGCVAYVYDGNSNQNCWLKYALNGMPNGNPLRTAYIPILSAQWPQPTSSSKYILDQGAETRGNDLQYWQGAFNECAYVCDITSGCVGFTKNVPNGQGCFLKYSLTNRFNGTAYDTMRKVLD